METIMSAFRNNKTDTNPLILHANGAKAKRFSSWKAIIRNLGDLKISNYDTDITIVTWNNMDKKSLVETQLDGLGIPYINPAQDGPHPWFNAFKIESIANNPSLIESKYVLAVDSLDVVMNGDFNKLRSSLEDYNCKTLYSSELGAMRRSLRRYRKKYIRQKEIELHSEYNPYFHLCSGVCFSETENYVKFVTEAAKLNVDGVFNNCDQTCVRDTYLKDEYRESVKIDGYNKYFMSLAYSEDILELNNES